MRTIIGIAGHPASGKDMAAEYLAKKGLRLSSGDVLREEMKKRGIPTDRTNMRNFSKEMRAKHGNSYPLDEVAKNIKGNAVISGFRNLAEVKVFRERFLKEFILIAIDAPIDVRYKRIRDRQRVGDNISFERFKEEEDREREEASGSHEVDKVIAAADIVIENNGTKEEFIAKIGKALAKMTVHIPT